MVLVYVLIYVQSSFLYNTSVVYTLRIAELTGVCVVGPHICFVCLVVLVSKGQ